MKKTIPILALYASLAIGCSDQQPDPTPGPAATSETPKTTNPILPLTLVNQEEGGFNGDIRLSVESITEKDSTHEYNVLSTYEGNHVGLLLIVPKAKSGGGFGRGLIIKSTGAPSDRLLQALARVYKQKTDTAAHFINSITVPFFDMSEYARSTGATDSKNVLIGGDYKIFFEDTKTEDYAELYINIDPQGKWIELAEKDEEYRPSIIHFLRQR